MKTGCAELAWMRTVAKLSPSQPWGSGPMSSVSETRAYEGVETWWVPVLK